MKLIHLSDLHLGKRVNEFSMLEDQEYILQKIINIIDDEKPDGVLIAGDVYDKSVPSEDAMKLWDRFLNKLAERKLAVFAISGNHDSAVRFADHSELVENTGIHLSPVYNGEVKPYTIGEGDDRVNIFMLPFIKPAVVRSIFPDEEINDYTDACRVAIEHMNIDEKECNVLVAHQFVVGAERSDSEEVSVGGLDSVEVSVFDAFDYVALGHIHGPQKIKRETIRYSGTPLKYSFSETNHKKSVTILDIDRKNVIVRTTLLEPLRDLRVIKGSYEELTSKKYYEGTNVNDYIHVTLTDEDDIFDAMGKLRVIYPNLMKLTYDNKRTRENQKLKDVADVKSKSPMELFEEFYETQNNQPMSEEQRNLCLDLIKSIWEV